MIALNTTTEFLAFIQARLGYAPQHLEPGRFYRFGPRKSGWAKLFSDGFGGVFGDYRQNVSSHWSTHQPEHLSPSELACMRQQIRLAALEREAEQCAQWEENAQRNTALWTASVPAGDVVRSYLAARGLAQWAIPPCIRQHPSLAYWHADEMGELHLLGRYPAMLAPIVAGDKLLAIHRTYLDDGCKAKVPTPKKLTAASGPLIGACIPLALPRGGALGIAEGIETAVAASLGSGLPVVAAYCANALAGYRFQRGIERLVIFADNDPAGQQAATTLGQRALKAGITSKTLTPSKPGSDWADVWLEGTP